MNTNQLTTPELIGFEGLETFKPIALNILQTHKSNTGLLMDLVKMRLKKLKTTITTSSRLIQDRLCPNGLNSNFKPAMITLTYKNIDDWKPNHIRDYLTALRNFMKRKGFDFHYVWVAELQKRGAVHYHIVVWLPKLSKNNYFKIPKPDKSGMWKFGMSQVVFARKPVGYLVKYTSKTSNLTYEEIKKFPKGLRLYGCGGLTKLEKVELRFWRSPLYVRDLINHKIMDVRKIKGGYETDIGFVLSPWLFSIFINGSPFFIKVRESAQIFLYNP